MSNKNGNDTHVTVNVNRPKRFTDIVWLSFSEADERYLDLFRIGYSLGILAFIVYQGYYVFNGGDFDAVAFGTGFGAILFGGGVGVGLRGKFEDSSNE